MDMQAVKFAAEERVKRGQFPNLAGAVISVIADCLGQNKDLAYEPDGIFMDWNWRRLDACKAARNRKKQPLQLAA